MLKPNKLLDLHTHLFNARYIPLAGIFSHAMGKPRSRLATNVARLVERITGSSYSIASKLQAHSNDSELSDDDILDGIWAITQYELGIADNFDTGQLLQADQVDQELLSIILDLESDLIRHDELALKSSKDPKLVFGLAYLKKIVIKALKLIVKLMDPMAWGKAQNYLEFIFTMTYSEKRMVQKLLGSYESIGIENVEVVHLMMDMYKAYEKYDPNTRPPKYDFYRTQIDRMSQLQAQFSNTIGFSAFDPRRSNWRTIMDYAKDSGMKGVKFYPGMEYKPSDNEDLQLQETVNSFFEYCSTNKVSIFVHCTPEGFQTLNKLGHYSHPKYWNPVLEQWPDLRLCFGHSGGGDLSNNSGWMARTDAQWNHEDNYARLVSKLCKNYANVFCEMGYLLDLKYWDSNESHQLLHDNFERAIKSDGDYEFLSKVAYGSDWHMPNMIDSTSNYFNSLLVFFNNYYPSEIDQFFWRNAYRFLERS